jgi:hypothetical protein
MLANMLPENPFRHDQTAMPTLGDDTMKFCLCDSGSLAGVELLE